MKAFNFAVGDTLIVSPTHRYFFNMDTTFTYLGVDNLHCIRSDTTGDIHTQLLTETVLRYFTVVPQSLENE